MFLKSVLGSVNSVTAVPHEIAGEGRERKHYFIDFANCMRIQNRTHNLYIL